MYIGSHVNGIPSCKEDICAQRCTLASQRGFHDEAFAKATLKLECSKCKKERRSRSLVASSPDDDRFTQKQILLAPAFFANNDLKFGCNQIRAHTYGTRTQHGIVYSVAKDTASAEAFAAKSDIISDKKNWLQQHDRESGDLYGMLPLISKMPVAMTDHIDRSVDNIIMRGRVGHIRSWISHEKEKCVFDNCIRALHDLPKVVFAKFKTSQNTNLKWKLPGLNELVSYCSKNRQMVLRQRKAAPNVRHHTTPASFCASICKNVTFSTRPNL